MVDFGLLLAWIAVATIATVSPGPDTALVVAQSARRGGAAGIKVALGVGLGNLWYAALFGFGLMNLLAMQPTVHLIVKLAGAAYLFWIGYKMVRANLSSRQATLPAANAGANPLLQGLIANVLNPKIALFFLAAIPQFAGNGPDAPLVGASLILINGLINIAWLTIVATGIDKLGVGAAKSSIMRWLEGIIGVTLMGLASRVALSRNV